MSSRINAKKSFFVPWYAFLKKNTNLPPGFFCAIFCIKVKGETNEGYCV